MEDSIKGATGFELVFNYIAILYKYGVGLISLFCVAIIVFSGVQMITGGINSEAVNDAKERIFQAIFSLVLLLGSAFILNFVNPGFFKVKNCQAAIPIATANEILKIIFCLTPSKCPILFNISPPKNPPMNVPIDHKIQILGLSYCEVREQQLLQKLKSIQ